MNTTYYFAGHETLSNRGCEALLRGITNIIRMSEPDAAFLAPSFDIVRDSMQWSSAAAQGVRFIDAYRLPLSVKVWARVHAHLPAVRRIWTPEPPIPSALWQQACAADAAIMTGGDVLSLDYSMASLVKYIGQAESFIGAGKPVVLWAASVGPFSHVPDVERRMTRHLGRYTVLTVRESASYEYLHGLGLKQTRLVADPAFVMEPDPFDATSILPAELGEGTLGLNISPLIHLLLERRRPGLGRAMESALRAFLVDVLSRTGLSIVLVPHVDASDGGGNNSDFVYMEQLLRRFDLPAARVSLAPRTLSAPMIKHLLAQCRYFMGARTHATIAALSSSVPTCSLGYSIKARGLNRDLFGDERYVLDTKALDKEVLWSSFERLRTDEDAVRSLLSRRIPEWKIRARDAFVNLKPTPNATTVSQCTV